MALCRATLIFECGHYGWGETFWATSTDPIAVMAAAKNLSNRRAAFVAAPSYITSIRVSMDDPARDSQIWFHSPPGNYNPALTGSSDIPTTALLSRLVAGTFGQRACHFRGIPDAWVINGGVFAEPPEFTPLWDSWRTYITAPASIWGLKVGNATPGIPIPILNMINTQAGWILLQLADVSTFVIGDEIVVRGGRWAQGNAGRHRVQAVITTPPIGLIIKSPYQTIGYVPSTASLYKTNPTVQKFTFTDWERVVKKNTGKGFFLPVGRRSGVRL